MIAGQSKINEIALYSVLRINVAPDSNV